MDLPKQFSQFGVIDMSRLVMVQEGVPISLDRIDNGVLFIMARWAGANITSFLSLMNVLRSFDDLASRMVFIADTDFETTAAFFRQIDERPSGGGETYWVLRGKILHKLNGYSAATESAVRRYTDELLRA